MNHTEAIFHQVNFPFSESGTHFSDFLQAAWQLAREHPQILHWLEQDQDGHGLNKKRRRKIHRQRADKSQQGFAFAGGKERTDKVLTLSTGRPRMKPLVLWTFLQIGGYYGSFGEQKVWDLCCESQTLQGWLQNQGLNLPGRQTIIDNVKVVREQTWKKIHSAQMRWVHGHPLGEDSREDWETIIVDSTAISSASGFSKDSSLAANCLERIIRHWEKALQGCAGARPISSKMPKWHGQMKRLDRQINGLGKKKGAKRKRRSLYRQQIIRGLYAVKWCHEHLPELWGRCADLEQKGRWLWKERVSMLICAIEEDLKTLIVILKQANGRVLQGEKIAAWEKVLSLSDPGAAMIVKGAREAVLGYKVQLGRTGHGFISAMDVESGNAADSAKLAPMIALSNRQTGIKARQVSVDDGYSSFRGVEELIQLGVHTVSISGSKGKGLLGQSHWEDEQTAALRQLRPGIESTIYTIKHRHGLERMGRFGLKGVREDLWQKTVAFNLIHYLIRKRRAQMLPIAQTAA